MSKTTRLGRPPERPYETPSQDVMPKPSDGYAHPEGMIELDSRAEARWWQMMNEQRASVQDDERSYTQAADKLCLAAMSRSKKEIFEKWHSIQLEARQHVHDVTNTENRKQHQSPPRIQQYRYGSKNNFRQCTGVNLETLAQALAHLWMYRWLCSAHPYNTQLNTEFMREAQYGSVLMEETGFSSIDKQTGYSEHPALPVVSCVAGTLQTTMSDEEYSYGKQAVSRCMGFVSSPPQPLEVMLHSFIDDSDVIDVGSLPHRRWVLSPGMEATGFGSYYSSSMMYAIGSRANAANMGDFIAYPPPGWMPKKWFKPDCAWSCSVNPEKYWIAPNATVSVYQTRVNDAPCGCKVPPNCACPLHRRGESLPPPYGENMVRINGRGFGGAPCLIFRPQGVNISDGEAYEVLIQGLWAAGERITLRYIVRFYDFPE